MAPEVKQAADADGLQGGFGPNAARAAISARVFLFMFGLIAMPAAAQLSLPQHLTEVELSPFLERFYRIDLDTLPPRPVLIVELTPNIAFEDAEFEIRLENWVGASNGGGPGCHDSATVLVETEESGPVTLTDLLFTCDPDPDTFNAGEVDVVVRALSFGAAGAPAQVDISIYATTRVATNTLLFEVDTDLSPQTVQFSSYKDTTIYGAAPGASNGRGTLMWAGTQVTPTGAPPFFSWSREPLRPLLAFGFVDEIPFNAQINSADLRLYASSVENSGGVVSLYKVAASPSGVAWREGNAVAPGSQFFGAISSSPAANWFFRESGFENWLSGEGGDIEGAALDSLTVTSGSSYRVFSSPALADAVQSMVDTRNDRDGFLLTGPGTSTSNFVDRGVSFFTSDTGRAPFAHNSS